VRPPVQTRLDKADTGTEFLSVRNVGTKLLQFIGPPILPHEITQHLTHLSEWGDID